MIEELVKIHDKFTLEFKVGYIARKKKEVSDFEMSIWTFIPNSLDINRFTFTKSDFYQSLKSNTRLITPVFLLRDIAQGKNSLFPLLEKSFTNLASNPTRTHIQEFEYHIKMFLSIFKSSLREDVGHMLNAEKTDIEYLVNEFIANTQEIIKKYRNLYLIINAPTVSHQLMEYYKFGDEFMSNIAEVHMFRLMQGLKNKHHDQYDIFKKSLLAFIHSEIKHKKEKGYLNVSDVHGKANTEMVFRQGMLKKYAESHLFLSTNKRKDGVLVEQLFLSLAAGISMVFATMIAFSVQQKYGNFTMPLFVALVVSYMLKDRIKEFTRYYFANKMGSYYFDHKTGMNINQSDIGWMKESMDFISGRKLPFDILKRRDRSPILEANNRANSEKVFIYRTRTRIFRKKLDDISHYSITGVNSIIRLNLSNFISKMDNADFPLYYPDENDGFKIVKSEKIYYINFILHLKNDEQNELLRYRICLSRKGIQNLERL